jgi:hypothetical protein
VQPNHWANPISENWYSDVGLRYGQWDKVVFHGVINTPGVKDGVGQLWINDALVINASTIPYRNVGQDGFILSC